MNPKWIVVMKEEIFGPILPIISFKQLDIEK
jgi:acyl-CoA reductase-like NAD-dependent aldehyde dehydrogenase